MKRYAQAAICFAAGASAASTPAFSQSAETINGGVADIIVTASKREESANKVGLSVTALSGQALQERRITSLDDLAAAVPGLSFSPSETATPIFTLRGIGFNESSLGVYPAVSVYLDQMPLPFPVLTTHSNYDLERIEVLKGPQGTLFGQNATGGAINFVAAKPTDHFEAGGEITYGRFNHMEGQAHISGPITDQLKARIAVIGVNEDAWQVSITRPNDRNGKQSYVAGRILLDYEPSDIVHLLLNVNAWRDKSQPLAPQYVAFRPISPPDYHLDAFNSPFALLNPRSADWTPGGSTMFSNRRFIQASLRGDVDLSTGVKLISLTSYVDFTQKLGLEKDGNALIISDIPMSDGTIKTFNQELRIEHNDSANFRWVLGGNFERSTTFEDQVNTYNDNSSNNAGNLFINSSGVTNAQRITNFAGFANVEFNITPELVFKGGGRYTHSKIEGNICGYGSGDGRVADLFNVLGNLLGTVPFTPITGGRGQCNPLNYDGVPGQPFISTLTQDNVSWKVGVDYHPSNTLLLYANVSRGYKAGSFPTLAAGSFVQFEPVTQESVTTYEGGVKATLLNRRAQFNAAVFYNDYKDKQVRGKLLDPIFGTLDALVNVPKSRVWGAEAEITLRPVSAVTLNGSLTFLQSKIQAYSGYNVIGDVKDFSGQDLPFTPTWSYSINAEYKPEMANGGHPFFGATVNGRTSSEAALGGRSLVIPVSPVNKVLPGLVHPFLLAPYATVDFRAGYEAPGGTWRVMAWAKNAFNKLYWSNVTSSLDTSVRYAGLPATYGVTLGFKI